MLRKTVSCILLSVVLITGCNYPASQKSTVLNKAAEIPAAVQPAEEAMQPAPKVNATTVPTVAPTTAPEPTQAEATQLAAQAYGPDQFPAGINPLTGLPVANPANLQLPPALVSITNFPVTARPQAGLSFSPFIYEFYIGEGTTRFLAMFYGDYPQAAVQSNSPASAGVDATSTPASSSDADMATDDSTVGPIRSGRLPYESIRSQYNGFLVMASAWSGVASKLSDFTNVFGSDESDINSAMLKVTDLEKIARASQQKMKNPLSMSGLLFDPQPPEGGLTGKTVWMAYSFLNQIFWKYDSAAGRYARFQDDADGETFIQATDRLTKQPVMLDNVVILFANHRAKAETLIDIDLMYQNKTPALIFRDGKMYEAFWTTQNDDYEKRTGLLRPIRFVDAQGKPFALKPGHTWVEVVPLYTPYYETIDSQVYFDLTNKHQDGSGIWAVYFNAPKVSKK